MTALPLRQEQILAAQLGEAATIPSLRVLAGVSRSLPVTGSTDGSFVIDGISDDDHHEVLGHPPGVLVGQSLLSLIDPLDVARVMVVIEHMSLTTGSIALPTRVIRHDQSLVAGQLLLVPRQHHEGYIFALIAAEPGKPSGATAVVAILQRLGDHISYDEDPGQTVVAAEASFLVARTERWSRVTGMLDLSPRELEIVTLLVDGERVPTIARTLSLTQSTIRNHLSAAYSKVGVNSQQATIDLLRHPKG